MSIPGLRAVAATLLNISMPVADTRGSSSQAGLASGATKEWDEFAGRQQAQEIVAGSNASTSPGAKLSPAMLSFLQAGQEFDADAAIYGEKTETRSRDAAIQTVNGTDVIVSGHSLDAEEGVSRFRTFSGQMTYSPEVQAQLMAGGDAAPTLDIEYGDSYSGMPSGATGYYMSIDAAKLAGAWSPGSSGAPLDQIDDYKRQDVSRFLDLLDVERTLKAEHGEDVKLAYSHKDGGYIMLTRDDPKYDELASVEDNLQTMLDTIRSGETYGQGVIAGLRERGFNV